MINIFSILSLEDSVQIISIDRQKYGHQCALLREIISKARIYPSIEIFCNEMSRCRQQTLFLEMNSHVKECIILKNVYNAAILKTIIFLFACLCGKRY